MTDLSNNRILHEINVSLDVRTLVIILYGKSVAMRNITKVLYRETEEDFR
jgi:hypothetical protein